MIENDQFRELGLTDTTLGAIRNKGFEAPSPIQRVVIPVLLHNQNDIIGQAQTGTGKTAAFGLPILELFAEKTGVPQALILVPTRELALQVTDELLSFNINKKLSITPIYGGASISEQLRRLNKGTDIVVGTPGRILDHLRRGSLNLTQLHWLVLDEADEMLDMGFIEDVEEIMSHIEEPHRVLLFSATLPDRIKEL
ncbi:MAG: DEAD/DEAH box helicase, partial [Rikenellaceae bacterium]|nr:DEAD/DEAH box helicase [Rikenellaceae bacterium]